jgi:hypothetical protein
MTDYLRGVRKRLWEAFGTWYAESLGMLVYYNLHKLPSFSRKPICLILFRFAVLISPGERWADHKIKVHSLIDRAILKTSKLQRYLDGENE